VYGYRYGYGFTDSRRTSSLEKSCQGPTCRPAERGALARRIAEGNGAIHRGYPDPGRCFTWHFQPGTVSLLSLKPL